MKRECNITRICIFLSGPIRIHSFKIWIQNTATEILRFTVNKVQFCIMEIMDKQIYPIHNYNFVIFKPSGENLNFMMGQI